MLPGDVDPASSAALATPLIHTPQDIPSRSWIGRSILWLSPWSWMGCKQTSAIASEAQTLFEEQVHAKETRQHFKLRLSSLKRHTLLFQNQEMQSPEIWLINRAKDPLEIRYNEMVSQFEESYKCAQEKYKTTCLTLHEDLKKELKFDNQIHLRHRWGFSCYEEVRDKLVNQLQENLKAAMQAQIEEQYSALEQFHSVLYQMREKKLTGSLQQTIDHALSQAILNYLLLVSQSPKWIQEGSESIHQNWQTFANDYRNPD